MNPLAFVIAAKDYITGRNDDLVALRQLLTANPDLINRIFHWGGLTNHRDHATPLCFAVAAGNVHATQVLLQCGARVDAHPLRVAIHVGLIPAIQLFLQHGRLELNQTYDFRGQWWLTPLAMALKDKKEQVVQFLLDNGADPNLDCPRGVSPIFRAIEMESSSLVRLLVKAGANVNKMGSQGRSALMVAAIEGDVNMVRELLAGGAAINVGDLSSKTPLHGAAFLNRGQIVRLLLEKGADATVLCDYGVTAFQVACLKGNLDSIFEFFLSNPEECLHAVGNSNATS